jgi:hypothetical protein
MFRPNATPRRDHAFGDLYDLLFARFPHLKTDRNAFDVQAFAKIIGFANETVYKALREQGPLGTRVARRIILASRETKGAKPIYWCDLVEFILPDYALYAAPEEAETPEENLDDLLG